MGKPPSQGEHSGGAVFDLEAPAAQSRSFAELVAALQRLNALESALATAISGERAPVQEVRKLLRARTPAQAENAPAFQFMEQIFAQVGLPLTAEAVSRFSLTFGVEDTPYARLFAGERPAKTCAFVSEAIARFLATDLGLPAEVEEVACRNAGDASCLFAAALDPAAVRAKVLDGHDWKVLHALRRHSGSAAALEALGMDRDEFDHRMERVVGYGLATADGQLFPEAEQLLDSGPHPVEEPFAPPWEQIARLTQAIADAQSFAEALTTVAPPQPSGAEVDAEAAAAAAECRSFAELLARASRERSFE